MLKGLNRLRGLAAGTIIVGVGAGGAAAWAHEAGDRSARRDATRICVEQVKAENPDAGHEELRGLVRDCLVAAGYPPPELTPEQRERRAEAKACVADAREAHPGDRPAAIAAARECLEAAGVNAPPRPFQQLKRAQFHDCLTDAREAHGDDRPAVRAAVAECMRGGS